MITLSNQKKSVAMLLILTLVLVFIPAVNAETTTVYHETFTDGTGVAVQSGGASLTQVTGITFVGNDDGAALYVSNRTNNWDAADFRLDDIGLVDGNTCIITVRGYVDEGVEVPDGAQVWLQTVNSYGWWGGADLNAGKSFTLTGEYTVDTSNDISIRIQSNDTGATVPFYIGEILVTGKVKSDVGDDEPPRPLAEEFTTITFEEQSTGGFEGRAGTETLTITNEENHTEGGNYALKTEGRTSAWHGPSLRVEKYVDEGTEYKVSVWVKLIAPESSRIQLSTQIGDGTSANYVNLAPANISTEDGWVLLEGTYRYNNVSSEYLTIYVESSNNAETSFYIDDISFESTGSKITEIQTDIDPVKDIYQNDFLIGTAISSEDLNGIRFELLKKHFNSATAGNAMKPGELQHEKGNFTFEGADTLVDKILAEGIKMHGHTLLWHQQSPVWMNTSTDEAGNTVYLSREEALENMRNHVMTVVEHFGSKVISWDVVNEAMSDNPATPADWKASLRQSPWFHAIGEDYVEKAFLAAREVLDQHPDWDIKLYYNDYNLDNQNKALAVYNMVKDINENYQKTHPGKLLIDGVGMQGHFTVNTNPTNVLLSLKRFVDLGVEVSITELDIQAGADYQISEKEADAQGYLYAQLFKIFNEYAEHIARVTLWGMDDGTSWRSATNPLIFDKNLQAKPAYYAIIDTDKFIDEQYQDTSVYDILNLMPKQAITRGEAIVMIMKAYGIKPVENYIDNFTDATGDYAGYFAQAKAIGLTNGIGNNMIGADIPLTYEMLYTLIYNTESIINELSLTNVPVRELSSFSDYSELSDWSVEAVKTLVETGVFEGFENNLLPKKTVNEDVIETMLNQLLPMN